MDARCSASERDTCRIFFLFLETHAIVAVSRKRRRHGTDGNRTLRRAPETAVVLNDPDLETTQPVRPDGKIAFFPAGDLQAAGRTVEQLRDEIVSRLRAKTGRSYRLGIQDVIEIKVYGHGDLDSTQTIGPDGTISILPGGSIRAAGKTVDELADEITKRGSDIVQDPILNVSMPKNELGTAERYFDFAVKAIAPVVSAESAIVLGGSAVTTLQGKGATVGTSINLSNQ
jgi:hypothetical protein